MHSAIVKSCVAVTASLLAAGAHSQIPAESLDRLYNQEDAGLRYYERGNYDKAFDSLSATAARGLKRSQYILAFMFLKGQHVDQSLLLGMGWLGVATESGDPEWIELYQSLYNRASPDQRAQIDKKVAQYIEQYGLETQNVSCSRRPAAGSRRIESRCIKADAKAYPLFPVERKPR